MPKTEEEKAEALRVRRMTWAEKYSAVWIKGVRYEKEQKETKNTQTTKSKV